MLVPLVIGIDKNGHAHAHADGSYAGRDDGKWCSSMRAIMGREVLRSWDLQQIVQQKTK